MLQLFFIYISSHLGTTLKIGIFLALKLHFDYLK